MQRACWHSKCILFKVLGFEELAMLNVLFQAHATQVHFFHNSCNQSCNFKNQVQAIATRLSVHKGFLFIKNKMKTKVCIQCIHVTFSDCTLTIACLFGGRFLCHLGWFLCRLCHCRLLSLLMPIALWLLTILVLNGLATLCSSALSDLFLPGLLNLFVFP